MNGTRLLELQHRQLIVKPYVVAIIASYNRPGELRRLLDSLTAHAPEVQAVVVVDNGGSVEVKAVVESWTRTTVYLAPGKNLGCGGGLHLAGETALARFADVLTHLVVLDDDAVVTEGAMSRLLEGMAAAGAAAGCAMVVTGEGHVSWLPGLTERRGQKIQRQRLTPEEYLAQHGSAPVPFTWAQGICLAATRELIEGTGFHRDDFWVRGEDLEYSLRLTAKRKGVWVPGAVFQHLPPAESPQSDGKGEYLKHCAMLQNIAYIACRLPHGRRILWTIPSNVLRFLRTWGLFSLPDTMRALWRGVISGVPAGRGEGMTFFQQARPSPSRAVPARAS